MLDLEFFAVAGHDKSIGMTMFVMSGLSAVAADGLVAYT